MQTLDDGGISGRNAIAEWFRAIRGANSGRVEQILAAPGNAVERAAIFSGGNFGVGVFGLRESQVFCERNDATELWIEAFDAFQINLRQTLGRKFTRFDPAGKFCERRERDVVFFVRERAGIGIGAKKCFARGSRFLTRQNRIPLRVRRNGRFDRHLARADAALVNRC